MCCAQGLYAEGETKRDGRVENHCKKMKAN